MGKLAGTRVAELKAKYTLLHDTVRRYAVYWCGNILNHIYIPHLWWDLSCFVFPLQSDPEARIWAEVVWEVIQKLLWESREMRLEWEESSWGCVTLGVNTIGDWGSVSLRTLCVTVEHTSELSHWWVRKLQYLSVPLWLRIASQEMSSWHI